MPEVLLDAAGRPCSPATVPGFHAGCSRRNKGQRYPADPPTVAEIVAVMRHAGSGLHASRLRALIVLLWRAGLRIHEALALGEADLDPRRDCSIRDGAEVSACAPLVVQLGSLRGRRRACRSPPEPGIPAVEPQTQDGRRGDHRLKAGTGVFAAHAGGSLLLGCALRCRRGA